MWQLFWALALAPGLFALKETPTPTEPALIPTDPIRQLDGQAVCEITPATLWDGFLIRGSDADWDLKKLGRDNKQQGLLDNLRACGWVSDWGTKDNKTGHQDWEAWGKLPWPAGQKCIPDNIKNAGGPDVLRCQYIFVQQQ